MTKVCKRCNTEKPISDFNRKGTGYQPYCRKCQKTWYKNYYDGSDRERKRLYVNNTNKREEARRIIRAAKDVPCADCNQRYPYYVMDFDHIEDNKLYNIGSAVGTNISNNKIQDEISKCEVVCANCHRERTHHRRR